MSSAVWKELCQIWESNPDGEGKLISESLLHMGGVEYEECGLSRDWVVGEQKHD